MVNAYRQHDRLFQNEKINCDYFYLLKFVGRAEFNSVPRFEALENFKGTLSKPKDQ